MSSAAERWLMVITVAVLLLVARRFEPDPLTVAVTLALTAVLGVAIVLAVIDTVTLVIGP